jgi:hypothetical protein
VEGERGTPLLRVWGVLGCVGRPWGVLWGVLSRCVGRLWGVGAATLEATQKREVVEPLVERLLLRLPLAGQHLVVWSVAPALVQRRAGAVPALHGLRVLARPLHVRSPFSWAVLDRMAFR